jgi:hypothetical protein
MTRDQALPYVSFAVDDAGSPRGTDSIPANARLVGWQCGFEPLFVAVWSYLSDTQGNLSRVDDSEAELIALEYLTEIGWFSGEPTDPDYVI